MGVHAPQRCSCGTCCILQLNWGSLTNLRTCGSERWIILFSRITKHLPLKTETWFQKGRRFFGGLNRGRPSFEKQSLSEHTEKVSFTASIPKTRPSRKRATCPPSQWEHIDLVCRSMLCWCWKPQKEMLPRTTIALTSKGWKQIRLKFMGFALGVGFVPS